MKLKDYDDFQKYLSKIMRGAPLKNFTAKKGLDTVNAALKLLGNPQENLKIIHIAGTSGKGSIAIILSQLLNKEGFKVGTQLSPYLYDVRERFLIDLKLTHKRNCVQYANEILKKLKDKSLSLSYFEFLAIFALYTFHKEKVDYVVLETGLGGLYDGTNCNTLENKVCILSSIGYDHMHILGDTLEEIAAQKAGIIHEKNKVFALKQSREIRRVFEKHAEEKSANLEYVDALDYNEHINYSSFRLHTHLYKTNLRGKYNAQNCALALSVLLYLSKRDSFPLMFLPTSLLNLKLPGRLEEFEYKGKNIIIDGAHNEQKMRALVSVLKKRNEKFTVLFSCKKGRSHLKEMLEELKEVSSSIAIVSFKQSQDSPIESEDPKVISALCKELEFSYLEYTSFEKALEDSMKKAKGPLLITGSLYLLSEVYKMVPSNHLEKPFS